MGDRTVNAIIQDATSGEWGIPEFQREFEWSPEKVATLCNSLFRDLPIGVLTVWKTSKYNQPQMVPASGRTPLWIVDGQQRVTSLCVLKGSKPYWMSSKEWNDALKKRIVLNINKDGEATIANPSKKATVKIPLDQIINKTASEAQAYVQEKCAELGIADSDMGSNMAVDAVRILDRVIPVAEVGDDKEVEEIAELYRRLNQQGMRLRQGQIALAYVSQYNEGWVRKEFYPYLENLKEDWELDAAHVLQVATILAEGKARVGKADLEMWQSKIEQFWPKVRQAIDSSIVRLWDKGITDEKMVPSSYTLITLFAVHGKFPHMSSYDSDRLFKWFIQANLAGHYSDRPLETLTKDASALFQSTSFDETMQALAIDFEQEELREKAVRQPWRDNSSQALLLHVLLWASGARDLLQNHSIPALAQGPQSMEPHWHHIVPKGWGKENGFEDCNSTANLTRICGQTNTQHSLKFKPPWEYVPEFSIPKEALIQHLIPGKYAEKFVKAQSLSPSEFQDFLKEREEIIVQRGTSLLGI